MTIQPINSDDIIKWPDGHHCYRSELHEYAHRSDDYEVIAVNSAAWVLIVADDEHVSAFR